MRPRSFFGKGKMILCYADKAAKNNDFDWTISQVWDKGKPIVNDFFRDVHKEIGHHLAGTDLVIMDGCVAHCHSILRCTKA